MNTKTSRRAPNLRVVRQPLNDLGNALTDLEEKICDLDRAARIAFLMQMHDAEHQGDEEPLALFAVEQVESLASELRRTFYEAMELRRTFYEAIEGKAVRP